MYEEMWQDLADNSYGLLEYEDRTLYIALLNRALLFVTLQNHSGPDPVSFRNNSYHRSALFRYPTS